MNCHLRDIGIPSVAITSTDDPLLKPFDEMKLSHQAKMYMTV